ncbi:MAG: sigma-54 dependent transcriptional regulator [Capsulimonadaceae bacterium]|nr:sigma-54 dependent transcriptional regulator [Capsulimonadaceae bacterium]
MATSKRISGSGRGRHLLVADDEPSIRRVLEAIFTKDGYTVHIAENGRKALDVATHQPISVLITDLIMPDMNGVDLLKKVREKKPDVVVIMITAYGTIKTAVDAIRYGAAEYITKPFDVDEIRAVVARAVLRSEEQASASVSASASPASGAPVVSEAPEIAVHGMPGEKKMILGRSAAMKDVWEVVRRAAGSRATVLIRGESGTGKELVARALHHQSDRSEGPFVAVSCAALPETLLESELFGHEKNAFTGAATQRIGRFELADEGTLFLDEIGDISPSVQIKLLRVLQERAFERIGGSKSVKVNVRLVAATNADLEALAGEGKFRSDLYYRLHVIQIVMPPLRDRIEDIPDLAREFLRRFALENGRKTLTLTDDSLAILEKYPWPGNVRELENVMERCVVMADRDKTSASPDLLPSSIRDNAPSIQPQASRAI